MTYTYEFSLEKLVINDFRGFENSTLEFDKQLTVLIGENGSGKSSILDLLQEIVRHGVNSLFGKYISPHFHLTNENIKYGKIESANQLFVGMCYFYWNEEDKLEDITNKILFEYQLNNNRPNLNILAQNKEENGFELIGNFREDYQSLVKENKKIHLPVLSYYAIGEIASKKLNTDTKFETNKLSIYDDLNIKESVNFENLKKWLEWQQKRDNQKKLNNEYTENGNIIDNIYANILALLNDEDNTYEKIEISWENTPKGEIILYKKGIPLRESQLSSGEKVLFSLVADISIKLTLANPYSKNPSQEGKGVILIDEIDLHLHPKWQRKVINKLLSIFPNIQFVVTTHSPLILNHIPSKYIRSIQNSEIYGVEETEGQEVSTILENIMLLDESSKYGEDFENIYKLIRLNNISEAKNILETLNTKIEGKHPEVLKLQNLIKKKEFLSQ